MASPNAWDEHLIRFLPLVEIRPVNETGLSIGSELFVFADYSLSAHEYAIRLSEDAPNVVALIHGDKSRVVAHDCAVVLSCVLLSVSVMTGCVGRSASSRESRTELTALFDRLDRSYSKDDVKSIVAAGKYKRLTLIEDGLGTPHVWLVTTPLELGATNWQLWLEFSGSKLRASRIRTADSKEDHPPDAPPDREWK